MFHLAVSTVPVANCYPSQSDIGFAASPIPDRAIHFHQGTIHMNTTRILSAALFATSLALTSVAQAQPAAASAPKQDASIAQDCAKMAKHEHGADKGLPMTSSKSGPCARVASASAPKGKPVHNHARDAKNQ